MSNNPLSKYFLNFKTSIKSNSKLILIVVVLISLSSVSSFFYGVKKEFKDTISKDLVFYKDYYLKVEETNKVNKFRIQARKAEHEWKVYHVNPSRHFERDKSLSLAKEIKEQYFTLNPDYLSPAWKLYAYYHYAYLNLICADIEGSKNCLDEMEETFKQVDIIKAQLNSRELLWYKQKNLRTNMLLLKLQFAALNLINDSESTEKQDKAIAALNNYGTKKQIDKQELFDDRLIGAIYNLAYPKKYRVPK